MAFSHHNKQYRFQAFNQKSYSLEKERSKNFLYCPKNCFCKKHFTLDVFDSALNMFCDSKIVLRKRKTILSFEKRKTKLFHENRNRKLSF